MPAVAPAEFPPPVEPVAGVRRLAHGPGGRAHRGRGRDRRRRPRGAGLRDPADPAPGGRARARRVARRGAGGRVEKGKATGAHTLSGANMRPSAMRELFPDLDPSEWPVYQEVEKDAVYLLTKRAALPLKPMPPNFRNHGNYVTSVAKLCALPRREGRGGGRLPADRDRGDEAPRRGPGGQGRPLGRQGPRPRGQGAGQLRARLGPDRQGDRARRGHGRPPHRRRDRLLRPPRPPPAALGAGRQGGLEGVQAARPGDPHDGLAASQAREVERVRRLASSTRWARTRSASAWSAASTTRTPPSRSTTPSSS